MVFKCQEDSFLKEFTSKVVTCDKVQIQEVVNGTTHTVDSYEVILEDTILFPEGGGQPCDYGFLNNLPVKKILRKEDKAVHYVSQELQVGTTVEQKIDWERRFDHMQQHSGQHLLSAVLEQHFKANTVSWWLGEEDSYVELDIASFLEKDIQIAEEMVNVFIRQGKPVTVTIFPEKTPEELLEKVRSVKGLPDDHKGDIRVINITDIDSNMCCGTHVTNLSQLQAIKLLHTEKSKRKDKILLHFLVGNRVLKRFAICIEREKKLTAILNNGPQQHVELVEKLQKNVKIINKNLQSVLKDVAIFNAGKLKAMQPPPKHFSLHKKEAEPDFMNIFIRELGTTEIFLFLSVGDEKKDGSVVIQGKEDDVAVLGPKVCKILEGKGSGKGNTYRAKVTNMSKKKEAENCIKEYFDK
ncbi:alanyl-tRNA editing protein Aarsd1-B [Diabrotica virgifera virgifera]|uniref:Alanyl-transfer RNA synthetases family profile domain-containing protein n=1 Tax=Diabrotica virgifera virgifera TaxID=50390 RepID=A0ABM5INJ2_DIAVI|nr:alanyl-tRNA editing protein Aarsd1-B [Diabrotica virgifera virgifera]